MVEFRRLKTIIFDISISISPVAILLFLLSRSRTIPSTCSTNSLPSELAEALSSLKPCRQQLIG
jgi:hypothetical protein